MHYSLVSLLVTPPGHATPAQGNLCLPHLLLSAWKWIQVWQQPPGLLSLGITYTPGDPFFRGLHWKADLSGMGNRLRQLQPQGMGTSQLRGEPRSVSSLGVGVACGKDQS